MFSASVRGSSSNDEKLSGYRPDHQAVLPYLIAFQCEFALRTLLSDRANQFDLVSEPNMQEDVSRLMSHHLRNRKDLVKAVIARLAEQFGNGLGFQLRSMPVAMRIDKKIHDNHPELRELQRRSIERQLQENMYALGPQAKEIAPPEIVTPNASMNAAFAKFFAGLWQSPLVFAPYVAAGFGTVAQQLIDIQQQVPEDSNHDRELVDAWAKHVGLDRWFATRSR